jgi:hypothetical protein
MSLWGFSLPNAPTACDGVQAEGARRCGPVHEAGRGGSAAASRRPVLVASCGVARGAAARRVTRARAPARPAPRRPDPSAKRIAELERQVAEATARAERAEALVAVQKEVAALWDQLTDPSSDAPTGRR